MLRNTQGRGRLDWVRQREREQQEAHEFRLANPSGALIAGLALAGCYRHHPLTWAHGPWLCGVLLALCVAGCAWRAFWHGVCARLAGWEAERRRRR